RPCKILFHRPGYGRIQRRKNKVAFERRLHAFHHQFSPHPGNRRLQVPANRFGKGSPRGPFRRRNFGQLEPRVFGKQVHQSLPDDAGCAQHSGPPFLLHLLHPLLLLAWLHFLIPPILNLRAHTAPPEGSALEHSLAGPIRVPRACGLNVLRTHTTISLSAASGSTLGCSTFAPPAASACASS